MSCEFGFMYLIADEKLLSWDWSSKRRKLLLILVGSRGIWCYGSRLG